MTVQRYKISLNNARFPLVSSWGYRAVMVPSMDTAGRGVKAFIGAEENTDYNIPQILYGENFIPVSTGVKSVSYVEFVPINSAVPAAAADSFDQVFPLRDADENTVLFSPSKGRNYVLDAGTWVGNSIAANLLAQTPSSQVAEDSENTPETAKVTRAYVDGKTFVCYSRLGGRAVSDPPGPATIDVSLYFWEPGTILLTPNGFTSNLIINLPIPIGEIDGISSSNGYLLVWSGLTVYWAPFNGTAFAFDLYANGEVTGAGNQIPEDIQGPITAIIPMSGGYIIFTTKNAIAAFYNANNFASPWIFRSVGNAGGIESFEQAASDGSLSSVYTYTTGGMQRLTLNASESVFPDVTDFFGAHFIESFNTGDLTFEPGEVTAELFVKATFCGQRFLVLSYGTFPGIFSYALIYDATLQRWGKLRIVHRDCFSYSYGAQDAELTYNMLGDVTYDELGAMTYDGSTIQGGALTYPRQSIAFLQASGAVKIAVTDWRSPTDDSEAFVVIGKNQLTRARLACLHEAEIDGLRAGGAVAVWRSINGKTLETAEAGYLREQTEDFAEIGFDVVTGKSFTLYIKGDFSLSDVILHASVDASF